MYGRSTLHPSKCRRPFLRPRSTIQRTPILHKCGELVSKLIVNVRGNFLLAQRSIPSGGPLEKERIFGVTGTAFAFRVTKEWAQSELFVAAAAAAHYGCCCCCDDGVLAFVDKQVHSIHESRISSVLEKFIALFFNHLFHAVQDHAKVSLGTRTSATTSTSTIIVTSSRSSRSRTLQLNVKLKDVGRCCGCCHAE